jgi:mTERF domain-containing protein
LDDENLGKALACKPQLIACDIEEGWKPLVKLLYYLGVDGYGLRKILVIQPSVFCLSLTNNIAPKVCLSGYYVIVQANSISLFLCSKV